MFGSPKTMYRPVKVPLVKPKNINVFQQERSPSPKPSAADNANNAENWPQSLKDYVNRAFASCTDATRPAVAEEMRQIIFDAFSSGTLWTIDWDATPLPGTRESKQAAKKRKKFSINALSSDPPGLSNPEQDRREKRARRFEQEQQEHMPKRLFPLLPPAPPVNTGDVIDWDEYTVVGTSQKLEKPYLRLTSAPDPASVRPLPVLRKTLDLLLTKWKENAAYTYICDQFKSLRQDLTVQRIKNDFTVRVYEMHARIALEKGDLGEYNQCASQLRQLYALGLDGSRMEFMAYRILYLLHTRDRSGINAIMAELTPAHRADAAVRHALSVRSALATSNYHLFFDLYVGALNMSAYLMDHFVERERCQALCTICRAFRPEVDAEYVGKELAFADTTECVAFLKAYEEGAGVKFLEYRRIENAEGKKNENAKGRKNKGSYLINTKDALPCFTEKLATFTKVDIKGQL